MQPTLQPMRPEEFDAFFELATAAYAADNVSVGRWREADALELARAETRALLPNGQATPGHFLFRIVPEDPETTAGYLWFATTQRGTLKIAYVFQLYVLEPYRRHGYGRAALMEAEATARENGHHRLALNVFASNSAARALYASLGYETEALNLAKTLG